MQKIGVIIYEDGEAWGGEVRKGEYITTRFKDNCTREDVMFEQIYVINGELPNEKEINIYTGFVFTGSRHSANENTPWMQRLEAFVRSLHQLTAEPKPKMFGICFGHQFIAKALGGEVSVISSGKFRFGGEVIQVAEELKMKDFYTTVLGDRTTFKIMQSHGEEVTKLAEHSINVGTSDSCSNEMLSYGSHILSTQGHPELINDKMLNMLKPQLLNSGRMNEEDVKKFVQSLEDIDSDLYMKNRYAICRTPNL